MRDTSSATEKFVVIDGNSLLNRAFYATPLFTTKDGFPSNAIFGFVKLLLKIISDKKPQYLAVTFDVHAPTFRHKMYSEYKAGRRLMPPELVAQVPVLKDLLRMMSVAVLEKEGYEADDLIGTLSRKFPVHTYIYTGDRDSYQLVYERASVCFTRKGVSDILQLDADNFTEETGLTPPQIVDLKSLMGDKSDHIPGVAGIGEQTAKSLLEKYATLQGVYENIDALSAGLQTKLKEHRDEAFLSYELAKIDVNVPLEITLSECVLKTPFPYAVRKKFAELDFRSLASMDIFEEEVANDGDAIAQSSADFPVKSQAFFGVEGLLSLCEKNTADFIVCLQRENDFRILVKIDDSYVEGYVPFKQTLLDEGVFPEDLGDVYSRIFTGSKKVICYDMKAFLHRLEEFGVEASAPYEDVALAKYLAEGSDSSESLTYLLDAHGYSAEYPTLGLYRLYLGYIGVLSKEEFRLYEETELPLVKVLYDMEKTGIRVDKAAIDELSLRYEKEIKEVSEKIFALAGERFNLNSPAQLSAILFDKLHIDGFENVGKGDKTKKTKKKGTSAEILEKYADEHEIVRLVLRFRQIQKLNSTYVEGMKPLICGDRIHTTYNQTNTTTGRLSSANPNLQNIPIRTEEGRELRKIFLASEGNVLVDADYSQIELRLLAHFSDCKALKEAYTRGDDVHAATAAQVFDVPIEEVTPQMRREAKAVNFGIIYGMSAFGLSKDLGITSKAAKEYIDKYFKAHGEVREYIDKNVEFAKEHGYAMTLYGRKREIRELKSSNFAVRAFGERAAMNMPLQGTGADIIKTAMLKVYRRFKAENLKAKLVLQVHDELLVDCPIGERDTVEKIVKEEMESAASLRVPLVADLHTGNNWYDAH